MYSLYDVYDEFIIKNLQSIIIKDNIHFFRNMLCNDYLILIIDESMIYQWIEIITYAFVFIINSKNNKSKW